jgi:hypothetical protein
MANAMMSTFLLLWVSILPLLSAWGALVGLKMTAGPKAPVVQFLPGRRGQAGSLGQ